MRPSMLLFPCLVLVSMGRPGDAADWPMWRHNAGRTAATNESLPETLSLVWERELPPITPAFHSPRLQFDASYEPVVAQGRLLLNSSRSDSVSAYDAATGADLWTYRTNGPVRLAPAVWKEAVCFGSDDGSFYCVDLKTGQLRWRHQAVPNDRQLLGNRRLISVWPVRGGPVVYEGIVYFAAGVWPFEGVFVYAMDIETGQVIWRNDRMGALFGQQPHNTEAIGGLAPQGYLLIQEDELIVPCSTAYPARLNRHTGELIEFSLPGPGRLPGGWFAALDSDTSKAIRRGQLTFDSVINSQLHEDKVHKGKGIDDLSRTIRAGDVSVTFDRELPGIQGTIGSMILAESRLYVVTDAGRLCCFAADETSPDRPNRKAAVQWKLPVRSISSSALARKKAREMIDQALSTEGYAIVAGIDQGDLFRALILESQMHVIAIDDNAERVELLRRELAACGLDGTRAAVVLGNPLSVQVPRYIASLVTTETPNQLKENWGHIVHWLRPHGGVAVLPEFTTPTDTVPPEWKVPDLSDEQQAEFQTRSLDRDLIVRRTGPPTGSAEYAGEYALCEDELVRFPLGVLWFDDTLSHFKRSPQPQFYNGVMVSRPKDWHAPRMKGDYSVDYPLLAPVLSDIYTGRVFGLTEQLELRGRMPIGDLVTSQQSYYHAPHQKTALHPDAPIAGERLNPMTGKREPRVFPKTYGCDGGVDYGYMYTLRSGTAAFYDKRLESGTVFLSGPRSGCTNSIIPSGGVLNVPYFYEGCTCSYPLPSGMSLIAMPESHEQWSVWGEDEVLPQSIQRIGLNFGAPGDRMTKAGTLWLDYPSIGGPSPRIKVETIPATLQTSYRHSLWMKSGESWPWIAASVVEGLQQLTLSDLKPGRYRVQLVFAELTDTQPGQRVQSVKLQGEQVLTDLDIAKNAASSMKSVQHVVDNVVVDESGTLKLELIPTQGRTLISGLSAVRTPFDRTLDQSASE